MENSGNKDLTEEFKKLLALNSSLQQRLNDYSNIIKSRDNEIEMLRAMVTEAGAYRSNLDSGVNELKELQQNINQLQQQVAGNSYIGTAKATVSNSNTEQQFQNLKLQFTYLQTRHTGLEAQLIELNNRNLLLQQQTSTIAELESLLQNADEEINKWKRIAT